MNVIGDMFLDLDIYQNGFDLNKLTTDLKDHHNIDFDSVLTVLQNDDFGSIFFLKIADDDIDDNSSIQARLDPDEPSIPPYTPKPTTPTTTSFYFHFDAALSNNVMSVESSNILKRLANAIDAENDTYTSQSEYRQRVKNRVATIRTSIANVKSSTERAGLYKAVDTYASNIDATFKIVEKNFEQGSIAAKTNEFKWRRFLRKVRSVMISHAVGAYAGLKAGGLAGAIVGGAIGFVGSILDVAINKRCHYALKCSEGWMQNCNTGECMPRGKESPAGTFGQNPFAGHEVEGFSKVKLLPTESCRGCGVTTGHTINLDNIDVFPFKTTQSGPIPFSLKGMIDMSKAPVAGDWKFMGKNELGWPRNFQWFWQQYTDPHGALSPRNKAIIRNGGSPTVDAQWIAKMPGESQAVMHDIIHHHHVNKGRYAIPRSESLHTKGPWMKDLHPEVANSTVFNKRAKGMASHGKTIIGRLSIFADIYDIVTSATDEDPLATYNIIYSDNGYTIEEPTTKFKKGRLYWRQLDDTFIYVDSLNPGVGMSYTIYESHGYDGYKKEYIGVGKIAGPFYVTFVK